MGRDVATNQGYSPPDVYCVTLPRGKRAPRNTRKRPCATSSAEGLARTAELCTSNRSMVVDCPRLRESTCCQGQQGYSGNEWDGNVGPGACCRSYPSRAGCSRTRSMKATPPGGTRCCHWCDSQLSEGWVHGRISERRQSLPSSRGCCLPTGAARPASTDNCMLRRWGPDTRERPRSASVVSSLRAANIEGPQATPGDFFCSWECAASWNARFSPLQFRHERKSRIDIAAGRLVGV